MKIGKMKIEKSESRKMQGRTKSEYARAEQKSGGAEKNYPSPRGAQFSPLRGENCAPRGEG